MQLIASLVLFVFSAVHVAAADQVYYCNSTVSCPEEFPCCSQYGPCGTGEFCISNCNPIFSYEPEACMPEPVCKDISTTFNNYTDKVVNINTYLGNASEADWLYTGNILDYDDEGSMILAMPKNSGGTVLTSSKDVWYGKISARLKSSHLGGVVTAFIVFSGIQDEIDFEWVGADINTVQTNYYWQGLLDWHNSANITVNDTFNEYHTYEIDWHEDYTTWSVDGVIGRTLFKNATWNETLQAYKYPQTPSRIHLSIWPGGNATNAPGTIAWAGGEINWDAPDIQDPGYYYAIVNQINVTCYDTPSGTTKNGSDSYIYKKDSKYLQDDVVLSSKRYWLSTDEGTGLNVTAGEVVSSSSSSSSSSKTSSSSSSSSATSSAHNSTTANNSSSASTSTAYHNSSSSASSSVRHTSASISSITSRQADASASTSASSNSSTSRTSSRTSRMSSANFGSSLRFDNLFVFLSALGLLL